MKHSEVMEVAERFDSEPESMPVWMVHTVTDRETRSLFLLSAYVACMKGISIERYIFELRQNSGYEVTPVELCVMLCIAVNMDGQTGQTRTKQLEFINIFCEVEME